MGAWGRRLGAAAVVAVLAVPAGAGAATSTPTVVTIKDAAACGSTSANRHCFVPSFVSVEEGQYVEWSSQSTVSHEIELDDGSWGSGVIQPAQQNAFPHAFPPGDHPYHCRIHPSMTGDIRVFATEASDGSTSSDQESSTSDDQTTTSTSSYSFTVSSNSGAPQFTPTPSPDAAEATPGDDGGDQAGGAAALPSTGYSMTTDAGRQLAAVPPRDGGEGGHALLILFLVLVVLAGGSAAALWLTRPSVPR